MREIHFHLSDGLFFGELGVAVGIEFFYELSTVFYHLFHGTVLRKSTVFVAIAAVAANLLTPKPIKTGNAVTIKSIANPDALLMQRPMHMPKIHTNDKTIYGDFKAKSGFIVIRTSALEAPILSIYLANAPTAIMLSPSPAALELKVLRINSNASNINDSNLKEFGDSGITSFQFSSK